MASLYLLGQTLFVPATDVLAGLDYTCLREAQSAQPFEYNDLAIRHSIASVKERSL